MLALSSHTMHGGDGAAPCSVHQRCLAGCLRKDGSKWLRTTVTVFSKMQRVQQIYSPSALLFSSLCVFTEVKKC